MSRKELGQSEQDLAMAAYGQIAVEIYRFRRRVDQILGQTDQPDPDPTEIRVYS